MATTWVAADRADVVPVSEAFRPPLLGRTILLAPIPSLVPLVLWAIGTIPAAEAMATGGVLTTIAGAWIGYVRFDLWRCRRLADELLLAHPRAGTSSPLARWRAAELTSERTRRHLANWVHAVVRETEQPARLTWSPLNRGATRLNLFLLRRLEQELGDLSRPVLPSGVLLVRQLLSDGMTSPLYRSERADALPDALTEALVALDAGR